MARKSKDDKTNDKSNKVSPPNDGDGHVEEELWDLIRVVPKQEDCVCRTEGCQNQAVATWASNLEPDDKWDLCEPCQEQDLGGWPEGVSPNTTTSLEEESSTKEVPHVSQTQDDPSSPSNNEKSAQGPTKSPAPIAPETSVSSSDKNTTTAVASTPEPTTTATQSDEGSSNDGEPQEEVWDLRKILSFNDLNKDATIKCSTEDCLLAACSVWVSNLEPTTKWYSCLDCQEQDFDGWPPLHEMPLKCMDAEHLQLIGNKCSTNRTPKMPSFPSITSPSAAAAGTASPVLDEQKSTHFVTPPPPNSLFQSNDDKAVDSKGKKVSSGRGTKPNPKALAIHSKWQAAAEAIGGKDARIVVSKPAAKKLIFDLMFDAFCPMNITQIYKELKAVVPSPVLSACLQEMALDKSDDKNPFDSSDDEQEQEEKPAASNKDPYAGSLLLKLGKTQGTNLYYTDHNKLTGLDANQRNELLQNIALASAEEEALKDTLKTTLDHAAKLISEPTNEEITEQLGTREANVEDLRGQVEEAQKLKVNEKHKEKTKRRIQGMAAQWRKRKRLCMDFLIAMEENTDGTIQAKKCLSGDGPIALDSDENVAQAAIEYAKKKRARKTSGHTTRKVLGVNTKVNNMASTTSLANESFVAVNLDSQYNVCRIHVDDE
eukprot:scaffold10429_cov126-Cylindrotheca_fusiformis.AAC.3